MDKISVVYHHYASVVIVINIYRLYLGMFVMKINYEYTYKLYMKYEYCL
jgi:hypothetical protein